MAALGTAEVDCPRCDDTITVTLEAGKAETPKPGAKSINVPVRVVDLADRFAEHYQAAGHTGMTGVIGRDWQLGPRVGPQRTRRRPGAAHPSRGIGVGISTDLTPATRHGGLAFFCTESAGDFPVGA